MNHKYNFRALSDTIRALRASKGLSQENIADEIGIEKTAYSRMEKNLENASLGSLDKVSTVLGVSLDESLRSDNQIINYFNNTGNAQQSGGNIIIQNYPTEWMQDIQQKLNQLTKKSNQ